MRRDELGVEQLEPTLAQPSDQMHEGDLAGVGLAAEHAFTEKRAAERHAIEPPARPPSLQHLTQWANPRSNSVE